MSIALNCDFYFKQAFDWLRPMPVKMLENFVLKKLRIIFILYLVDSSDVKLFLNKHSVFVDKLSVVVSTNAWKFLKF